MAETPTLYVCHGDDGGPSIHPCRRVQEALRAAGIGYEKVVAAHGSDGGDQAPGAEARRRDRDRTLEADPRLDPLARLTVSPCATRARTRRARP